MDFIEKILKDYVESIRPEEEIRPELDIGYSYENNVIEIFEIRPDWQDSEIIRHSSYAKIKFIKSKKIFKLYWMRGSGKWESYEPQPEATHLDLLLETIEDDKYGCFKG